MPPVSPARRSSLARPFLQVFIAASLALTATMFLWWSENDAIGISRSLGDAADQVVSIEAPRIEPVNEGKLVLTSGEASADLPVQDPDLDLMFPKTLAVRRVVEMYQWIEVPNGPSYRYGTDWSSTWQDSSRFRVSKGHNNPPMQISSEQFVASDARLGDFVLGDEALQSLTPEKPFMPTETPRGWLRQADHFYLGLNPFKPSLGDVRVSYTLVPAPAQVTIIARQTPATFSSYEMRNGAEILSLRQGVLTADEMLAEANPFTSPSLWSWRLIALLVLSVSFYAMAKQAALIPASTGFTAGLSDLRLLQLAGAGALGICVALISVAWLFRLPFESAAGLVICGGAAAAAMRYMSAPTNGEGSGIASSQAQAT